MFQSQLLNNPSAVYSPWMSRGGDNIRFTLEVVDGLIGGSFDAQLYTKNSEDPGDGSPIGTAISVSSPGRTPQDVTGLAKEMVRYKFSWGGEEPGDWALFRMLPPIWYDDVKA